MRIEMNFIFFSVTRLETQKGCLLRKKFVRLKFQRIHESTEKKCLCVNVAATERKKIKVLPGFEPGLLDSKSRVITNYTIEPVYVEEKNLSYPRRDSNPQS